MTLYNGSFSRYYSLCSYISQKINHLKYSETIMRNCFHKNMMVISVKICHSMHVRNNSQKHDFVFNQIKLWNSCEEKKPGVIYWCWQFKNRSSKIRSTKYDSLFRRPKKGKSCINTAIKSHSSHFPLIWMFNSRKFNNLINKFTRDL